MSEIVLNLLPLTEAEQEQFRRAAPDMDHRFVPQMGPSGEILEKADPALFANAAVILGNATLNQLASAKRLRWLQTWSAGTDLYLRPGAMPQGAFLTSAVGAYGPTVAEHMLAMLLTLCKRLHLYRDSQRAGRWEDRGEVKSIQGATVLVVGAGDIGRAFGVLCHALGAYTVGLRRRVGPAPEGLDELLSIDQLDHWLPRADVAVLFLPHAPDTIHLMDARRLGLLKEGAILLNGGRGSAIDPDALLEALHSGRLWGVGLDVTQPEPLPPDHPLWAEENLLLTPHVAGGLHLQGTRERIVELALENLKRFVAEHPLKNRVR